MSITLRRRQPVVRSPGDAATKKRALDQFKIKPVLRQALTHHDFRSTLPGTCPSSSTTATMYARSGRNFECIAAVITGPSRDHPAPGLPPGP